jgi:hypothetical protein
LIFARLRLFKEDFGLGSQMLESLKRISNKIKDSLHLKRKSGNPHWSVSVAAFGKHPGWNDHMEDIGLDTDVLADLKNVLYLEGIGRNIDKGAWGKDKDQPSPREYGHEFLWVKGDDIVAGRLWPSRDGKGRSEYPMILCAHCSGLPLNFAVEKAFPLLEDSESLCVATDSGGKIRQVVENARSQLGHMAQSNLPIAGLHVDYHRATAGLAVQFAAETGSEGLIRILYRMDRDGVGICQAPGRTVFVEQRTYTRVPASPDFHRRTASLWVQFIIGRLGPTSTVLVLMPLGEPWMDIIVGEFSSTELYCLRASLEEIPLDSDVAYEIDPAFRQNISSIFQGLPDSAGT